MRHLVTILSILGILAPGSAWALDRQLLLGGDLSYAHEFIDESGPGGSAGAHMWYGITDAVAVGGQLAWAGHVTTIDDSTELRHVITAAAGIWYVLDIIRVVPYIGLVSGAAVSIQDGAAASYLVGINGGADVIVTPQLMVGFDVGYQFLVGKDILPARLTASFRLSWRHIFF